MTLRAHEAYRLGTTTSTSWTDWAGGVASLAQALAICVGGLWAYFKFIRGRTFAHRLEVSVTALRIANSARPTLKVTASLKNVGLSKLPLRVAAVSVFAIRATDGEVEESRIQRTPLFAGHEWVEADEEITDELLLLVPDEADVLGYRVKCEAIEQRSRRKGGLGWTATTVVAVGEPRSEPAQHARAAF